MENGVVQFGTKGHLKYIYQPIMFPIFLEKQKSIPYFLKDKNIFKIQNSKKKKKNSPKLTLHHMGKSFILSSLSPLTSEVMGTSQITLQQYLSTLPCLPLPSGNLQKSIPVHSLMLSSHLFFCLPLLLAPFTVPCRIVFPMPEDLVIV